MNADEQAFVDRYEAMALRAMERHGFAVPVASGEFQSAARREVMAKNRTDRAMHALTELQQWLVDDDVQVRQTARAGLRRLLYTAYVGDRAEERSSTGSILELPDRLLARLTRRSFGEDAPPPRWATERAAACVRGLNVMLTIVLALCTSSALAGGQLSFAVPLLLLTVLFDVLDGAFGRLVRLRNPRVRWVSYVGSHAADSVMLFGVVAGLLYGHPNLAAAVGGASVLSLLAALGRVSAVHAGYRYWRSAGERLIRWLGICVYIAAALLHLPVAGAVGLALLLTASACYELVKVARRVERLDVSAGGFIMVTEDQTIDSWRIEDDEGCPSNGRGRSTKAALSRRHTPRRFRRVRGSGGHTSRATSASSVLLLFAVVAVAAAHVTSLYPRPESSGLSAASASVDVGVVPTGAGVAKARRPETTWATVRSPSQRRAQMLCALQGAAGTQAQRSAALSSHSLKDCVGDAQACVAHNASLDLDSSADSATQTAVSVARRAPASTLTRRVNDNVCQTLIVSRWSTVGKRAFVARPHRPVEAPVRP